MINSLDAKVYAQENKGGSELDQKVKAFLKSRANS